MDAIEPCRRFDQIVEEKLLGRWNSDEYEATAITSVFLLDRLDRVVVGLLCFELLGEVVSDSVESSYRDVWSVCERHWCEAFVVRPIGVSQAGR